MTVRDDDIPWHRLSDYFAGTLSREEEAQLLTWAAADPTHEELLAALRELRTITKPRRPPLDPRAALRAIKHRDEPVDTVPLNRRVWIRTMLAAAAAVVILVGGGWFVRAALSTLSTDRATTVGVKEFKTTQGQRLAFHLPDGSSVMLAPESSLRYAASYANPSRTVYLEGEGYFEVMHDASRPFLVRAGHAMVRDLGTRFIVRAPRAGDGVSSVDVAVAEGQVAIGATGQRDSVVLDRADWGSISPTGSTNVRRNVPLDRYFGWTEGRLIFEATPLPAVAAELSRWYGVDVRLEGGGFGERRLTASFHNEPLTKVLSLLEASMGLDITRRGREIVLTIK